MTPFTEKLLAGLAAFALTALLLTGLATMQSSLVASARAADIPAPVGLLTEPTTPGHTETIVFAGGCFWGVQGVFQHVRGVQRAESGYIGGAAATAHYEQVSGGRTGHAEAVQVTYDPAQVSFGQLLQVFFAVVHDPTQLNRQGPDRGTQYRSAIFTTTEAQLRATNAYIAQLEQAGTFADPIVTQVQAAGRFHPAEDYHQDYMTRHPDEPYIRFHDAPKLAALQATFPALYRAEPVLVEPR
jgi:peptide-methionine (S)-S-oxide reductase